MSDIQSLSMIKIRAILYGGLKRNHPEITEADAGDIMSDAGIEETVTALMGAFKGATKAGERKPAKAKR
jgi:predicted membrane GTPase involved in stress response